MTSREIDGLLDRMRQLTGDLEAMYVENGGEVTPATEAADAEIGTIAETLLTEGVDSLGRWLRSKQDEAAAVKAEQDYLARRKKSVENTVDYIKAKITEVMAATGRTKVKGELGYAFATYDTVKTTVDADRLSEEYGAAVEKAVRDAGIPGWVTVKLGASSTLVPEGQELPDVFEVSVTPSVRFTKPRAAKEA